MKELTREVTKTEVVGYVADDGTEFCTKEECEKYEQTSKCVIKAAFEWLVVAQNNECNLFEGYGAGSEDWRVVLIRINNAEELKTANMYSQLCHNMNRFNESNIGQEIIVGVGDGFDDYCWVYGTKESLAERFKEDIERRLKPYEQDNSEGRESV